MFNCNQTVKFAAAVSADKKTGVLLSKGKFGVDCFKVIGRAKAWANRDEYSQLVAVAMKKFAI